MAYYGAVALDQFRADELCLSGKCTLCKECRYDHLRHIELLLDTLSHISQESLAKLTVLAATRKPTAVREVLIRLLAEGTTAHLCGRTYVECAEVFQRAC